MSEEEIKSMLETGSEAGVFNDIEKEMITSIFSFDDKEGQGSDGAQTGYGGAGYQ